MSESNKSTTSFKLKIIAIVSMFIDHIGAAIVEKIIDDPMAFGVGDELVKVLRIADDVLRSVGRLAFPLFIFMIAEGFKYTKNRRNYFLRLLAFAFISDIPFDLGFFPEFITGWFPETFFGQNVFFTLALGLGAIIMIDRISAVNPDIEGAKKINSNTVKRAIGVAGTTAVALVVADYINCDYGMSGVLAIIAAYIFRNNYTSEILAPVVVLGVFNPVEFIALFDVVIVANYRGEKGRNFNKWFFYLFYPVHLSFLVGIRELLRYLL